MLSKILSSLFIPPGLNFIALITAWVLRRSYPRLATAMFSVSMLSLLFLSSQFGTTALLDPLEKNYGEKSAAALPRADAIVVLGGYLRTPNQRHNRAELNEHGDRLWFGAQVYRCGKAPFVLLTGGASEATESEAAFAARMIEQFGVPANAVEIEQGSRSTYENGLYTRQLLRSKHVTRIILVTSAFHMPRAADVFRRLGFEVIAAPCDHIDERH